ncbi:MAG: hypothetical protein PUK61_03485 [[Actinobacillus] rossii]|nr:hypothetical protein [[Actinobacillus] rossii]MDD7425478.1 hypothetical protein [[Actinobacillus] rossii]MDY4506202.1 hypothetical protein [[Actinobacillus] rossii]
MKKYIAITFALFCTLSVQANNCNSFDNSGCSGYQSSTGTRYQYDMSNPSERLNYSLDLDAQRRDSNSLDLNRELDRGLGQQGGGIYQ